MRKNRILPIILLFSWFVLLLPGQVQASPVLKQPLDSTALELIDAVNAFRLKRGLEPYQQNSILMQLAQQQAEYNLSLQTTTHISADGLRPFQRALQAGYAVAGDLSLNGFFAENIVAGINRTAEEAVDIWTGDDPHLNTMISPDLRDIGAGVAVSNNTYYYVIDCGQSTGGTPRPFTLPPTYKTPVVPMVTNTPNADGSITYVVQQGDTLGGIGVVYDISSAALRALNGLSNDTIYPDQLLIVLGPNTPTPTQPTGTPTALPTITAWPTRNPNSNRNSLAWNTHTHARPSAD